MKDDPKEEPTDQMVTLGANIIKGEHYFEYQTGIEVQCTKCPLGYLIGPDVRVIEGHIYLGEQLLI